MNTFEEVYKTLPGNGWLSKAEAALLWEWVNKSTGPILEVGCYEGRSTCLLAATGRPVYAVDPFEGFSSDDPTGEKVRRALFANLKGRDLTNVTVFCQRIEDWQPRPVGFAYLDGDHTRKGTLNQISVAVRCKAKYFAVHDVNDSGDGLAIKEAALVLLGDWKERIERLAVWGPPWWVPESKR